MIAMLFSISNVKAYSFNGYDVHSKAYILAQNSEGVYEDYTCTSDTDYCTINITDEIYPLSRIVGKLYKNSFQFISGKNYKFTIFIKANFDISAYKNDLVFRLCANDYSCNILELLDSSIEKVDVDIYKISFIFNSILTTPQVVSFWFDNVSDVPVGSYYGVYKYHKLESYTPPIEPEEPEEPEETENYIYIPQMPDYPISTTLIDSYMKNKIDLTTYDDVFYETCYENGNRYFWAYYMPSSNDFSYDNSTGLFTINPVTTGTFYRVMFTVNSTGTITGMSSVETWNQSLTINYNANTNKRLYFSTFNVYDPNGNLLIKGFEKEEEPKIEEIDYITDLKQVFSIDLLFDNDISNKSFTFKLSSDYYDKISWDSVQYLGLVYENGLYHWEEIEFDPTDDSIMIEDAIETNENGIYTLSLKNVNFTKGTYQKIMLRLLLNNAIEVNSVTFPKEMTINDTIFFNNAGYKYIQNKFLLSGNGIKYLNFSTNSEYQETVYFDLLSEEYENKLHLDIFDTSTGKFKEYGRIRPYAAITGRYYANVDASIEKKVGFWLTLGDLKNDTCEFIYSFPFENIYWSESKSTANGENYISPDSTIKDQLTPSEDIVYKDANLNNVLKDLTNFIDKIRTPISFFFKCVAYFYNSLNFYIKGLITSLLTLLLMACVYKFVRRWNA